MGEDQTTPVLDHARFIRDGAHPNGFLHLDKKDQDGKDLKTVGYVRGTGIVKLATTVQVQKNNKKKYWEGTVTDGPFVNGNNPLYWTFEVVNKVNTADPDQDETITVTVTNPGATPPTSNPQPSDPQPDVIP